MADEHGEHTNTPESSTHSSDSEDSPLSECENLMPSATEPDVSLDEMLSLACRQGKLDIVQLLLQSGAHVNHRNKAGNTPLLEACSQGHVSVANYLLENGSKIDAPTESTLDSALTWACTLGNTNIVDALLYKKADVEHRTKDGCTALMFACLAGHRDVAEKLLDANSEINVESDSNKDSPLTFACWKGHHNVVVLLLSRKANIEHRTKEGFSPLMFAALGGHTKVARKLLEFDAQVNVPSGSNNDIPLTSACWKGHHDVVKLLLEFNSCIEHRTKDGCTPLMLAAREGHINVAELLLKNNAEVNVPSGSENNIPLTLACWKGHWEVVQLLLNYGSDIEHRNKAGCTPLMLAAREGHYETTGLLLEQNAQVNAPSGSNDDTPLTLACWKGHKDVVVLLLENKSNIDHQTKTGCTPLMEATREGHRNVAEILLNHNADVELPDNYGQSPLFMACWKGHASVAELLLQKQAYRDCRTKTGITPLFQACRENHVAIVELLLAHGASVNNQFPNSRENPLTLCAEKGHKRLVELLMSKGGSHDCRTKKGCTPEFLACKEGHLEIAQMLAEHGANLETPDCRGNTPIMAAFKNGHVAIVTWLIKYIHHLPSDELCHKILMSSVDEKDKEVIVQKRSKCLAIIQETKRKRELLALRNAQNLVQELDDEKNREEKKKKKKAAKRRDKKNIRKKRENDKVVASKINGMMEEEEEEDDDENDEEENKDAMLPTENRENLSEEKAEGIHLCEETSYLSTNKNIDMTSTTSSSRKKGRKKSDRTKKPSIENHVEQSAVEHSNTPQKSKKKGKKNSSSNDLPMKTYAETTPLTTTTSIASEARNSVLYTVLSRQQPKQSTQFVGRHAGEEGTTSFHRQTTTASTVGSLSRTVAMTNNVEYRSTGRIVTVTSVALSTCSSLTTSHCDPRTDVKNITPMESYEDWSMEKSNLDQKSSYSRSDSNSTNSSVSRNSSFDEFRESDWKELSRTAKMAVFELVVPNGYCGRVIGKGGKKINLITEESGGQITIDKPPSNVVPTERQITIKGLPHCAEKARQLVTRALNTPSLNTICMADSTSVPRTPSVIVQTPTTRDVPKPPTPSNNEVRKPSTTVVGRVLPTPDVTVTPLLSYSKVATGAVSLEELQKQLKHQKQMHRKLGTNHYTNVGDGETESSINKNSDATPSVAITSESFPSKEFSYFTSSTDNKKAVQKNHVALQNISSLTDSNSTLSKENFQWKIDEKSSDPTVIDRNRSISWTGGPNLETFSKLDGPGNRSLSTEAINDRYNSNRVISPWAVADELSDEHVFEDPTWTSKSKLDNVSSAAEVWELSSSPTSSVSSSKVELTNILDNDSGLSSSNPLVPTPPSVQSDSRISFQEQPYLDTVMDENTWLRSRGAYSAPSSPALQRSVENKSRTHSPKSTTIRSHPSMDELNSSRPWKKPAIRTQNVWTDRVPSPQRMNHDKLDGKMDNHDSGLSSPHLPIDKRKQSSDNSEPLMSAPTSWSAERFQDVHTLSDLLEQLSLEKYAVKLGENSINLESLTNLSERDLQSFGIPKGPRLKILKACDVMKSQKRLHVPQHLNETSSQLFFPTVPQPQTHDEFGKHQPVFNSYGYPDFMSYTVQQPFNVIIPNQPGFIHPSLHQSHPVQSSHSVHQPVFTNCDEFPISHPAVHSEPVMRPPYVYPDSQAFYFYPSHT